MPFAPETRLLNNQSRIRPLVPKGFRVQFAHLMYNPTHSYESNASYFSRYMCYRVANNYEQRKLSAMEVMLMSVLQRYSLQKHFL